ncbi:hypothetical protein CEP88_14020 [Roseobacter denitrificans]|nr:hypothetical protein [Roseobacter denitrificans]AVL53612.1 hypothetical protein CEP88_14020 [Roseobacter denitrificans]SFF73007.1 hypothetical protein SAMN05443635_101479 [Roseobacter denitrificans OCh 114]
MLIEAFGPKTFFAATAALQLGFAVNVIWRPLTDSRQPEGDKQGFVAMPANATGHMATELHKHGNAGEKKIARQPS